MTTVFLSGSRKINRINDTIRQRIDNMVSKQLSIIIGDANGADKAMQSYLAEIAYPDVTVFCSGNRCRNNIGEWHTKNIVVTEHLSGRDFYAQKDKEMARLADFGLVLWDGKSSGSMANVLELLKLGTKVVVYFAPEKKFYNVGTTANVKALLAKCDPADFDEINKKIKLTSSLREVQNSKQPALMF